MCCMSGVDACITWCGLPCLVVCVGCTLCVFVHGLGEGIGCLLGAETNPECV